MKIAGLFTFSRGWTEDESALRLREAFLAVSRAHIGKGNRIGGSRASARNAAWIAGTLRYRSAGIIQPSLTWYPEMAHQWSQADLTGWRFPTPRCCRQA